MRIILDFDHTLFDTPRLKETIQRIFINHGVTEDNFLRTFEESRGQGRDWKPERQFEILKNLGIPSVDGIRQESYGVMKGSNLFLYEDTIPFLSRIYRNHPLVLLTYGEDSFQKMKLDGCPDAIKYFDKIVITQNLYKDKEANELSQGKSAVFVDDNPRALAATKSCAPHIVTVRINRGVGRYVDEPSGRGINYEVSNLKEVENLIYENNFSSQ